MSIEERVKQIVADQFAVATPELKIDASMDGEYGMDDLDLVEITMSVEDEFGFEIDDDTMNGFTTARQIIDYVTAKVVA